VPLCKGYIHGVRRGVKQHQTRGTRLYYDSHCHLDFEVFDEDRRAVFERSRSVLIHEWMLAGVEASRWDKQRNVCSQEEGCVWAAGIHPLYIHQYDSNEWLKVLDGFSNAFSGQHAASAVGEIGLHGGQSNGLALQIRRLYDQLEIVRATNKPVIFHAVKAHTEMLSCLNAFGELPCGGVVHGFTGSAQLAEQYIRHGLHIGINGRWLYGGGRKVVEALTTIQLDHLLIESDSPDQSCERGARNESISIIDAARLIGRQKQLTTTTVLVQCSKNASRLFRDRAPKGE
jgi:TatD DNase family protein